MGCCVRSERGSALQSGAGRCCRCAVQPTLALSPHPAPALCPLPSPSRSYAAGEYLDAAFLTKLMCCGRELHDFLTLPAQVAAARGGACAGLSVAAGCRLAGCRRVCTPADQALPPSPPALTPCP